MVRRQRNSRQKVEGRGRGLLKILTPPRILCGGTEENHENTSVSIYGALYEIRTEYFRNKI